MATYTAEEIKRIYPDFFKNAVSSGVNGLATTPTPQNMAPEKNGFFKRVSEDFAERRKTLEGVNSSDQNLGSKILQHAGQIAGGATDIITEGVKTITPDPVEKVIGKGIEKVAETPVVQNVVSKYQEWKSKHPEAAANLEATTNILSLIPAEAGLSAGGKVAAEVAPKVVATGLDLAGDAVNLAGKGISEASGSLTGLNRGGLKALDEAFTAGGETADLARNAMRGKITPEQTQQLARESLENIISNRNKKYQTELATLKESKNTYDISPIKNKLDEELSAFQIKKDVDGNLDFSASPLRFNSSARKDIETIYQEMKNFGLNQGDTTIIGLDSLKRAFGDLYTESGEARKFVASMRSEVKKLLDEAPGYKKMSDSYSKSTELIKDIQKNLALNNRAGIDTAYAKLSQVLRKDTDARKQLLAELDEASGGKLIPMLSGTLANPVLPRGLTRPLSGLFAGGAGIESGGNLLAVLKAFAVAGAATSPRLAGEVVNALSLPKKLLKPVKEVIDNLIKEESLVKPTTDIAKKGIGSVKKKISMLTKK